MFFSPFGGLLVPQSLQPMNHAEIACTAAVALTWQNDCHVIFQKNKLVFFFVYYYFLKYYFLKIINFKKTKNLIGAFFKA